MKTLKHVFVCTIALVLINCTKDENNLDYLNNVQAPTNVNALFQITQDNTGLVTITPNSDGAVSYNIDFGDGSEPENVLQGKNVEHTYLEGTYSIGLEAVGITGLTTEETQQLVVSFRAPENLEVTAEIDPSNPFQINVSATADFAAGFEVYFDTSNTEEEPTPLMLGGTVSFEYDLVGDYTVKVVALSGGIETTEATVLVTISAPTELPIDFEIFDTTVFFGFGGASGEVVDNPDMNGNESAKVAKIVKNGPEVWAGNVIVASAPIDFSVKKLIKLDVWSPRPGGKFLFKLENLDDPNIFIEKEVTLVGNSQWEEVVIDFSDIDVSQSYQKLVWFFDIGTVGDGSTDWTFYIDNIRQDVVPASGIEGVWVMAPEAGSLGVGPTPGDTSWWNCDGGCVTARACYYDDTYVFAPDGSFYNILGGETWVEGWQGGSDACGTPVAPHDGSTAATYTYGGGTLTLNGTGAYIGLPKAVNAGELPNVPVPSSVTYNVTLTDNNNTMNVIIESGPGVFWQYKLIRYISPLVGTWKLAPEAGALGVGPAPGDISWWNCDASCVTARACYYDDAYVFSSDGSFTNDLGSETWVEGWQGGSDACGTPVAPHDGSGIANFVYDESGGTITLNGTGAYIGLPKAVNAGELPNVPVPNSVTYNVTFIDANTISVFIEAGGGVFWQYKLVRQ